MNNVNEMQAFLAGFFFGVVICCIVFVVNLPLLMATKAMTKEKKEVK